MTVWQLLGQIIAVSEFDDAIVMIIKDSRVGLAEPAGDAFFGNQRYFHTIIVIRNFRIDKRESHEKIMGHQGFLER